jgi:tetratricopeptide (TPR) repeat protein
MRRSIVVLVVLGGAFFIGAGLFAAFANEREYSRQISVGDEAAAADDVFRALEAYSGAIALKPDSMLAYLKRGRVYREGGELAAAARDLRQAAELDPTATLPLELLGDTYLSLNRYDRAADRYQAYLSLDDRSAGVWYKLGLALYRGGQAGQAARPLERAVGLDASLAEA